LLTSGQNEMASKVICMASAKGGSGKTVLTATFATFLSGLGKRVLVIDTDASTNGMTLMYFKETRMRGEFAASQRRVPFGMFEGENNDARELVQLSSNLFLLPATYSFKNTDQVSPAVFHDLISAVIRAADADYDYIFLDAQAGADSIARIVMSQDISHQVILVSEYDPLSAAGIERLKGLFREDLSYVRTWILLNKMLPEFVKSFSDFMEVAKYASPIPWDADVVRAYARRKLALDLESGNEYTIAIVQSLRSIFAEELEEEINIWLEARGNALKEPIETQIGDLEKQLEEVLLERDQRSRSWERRRFLRLLESSLVALMLSAATAYTLFISLRSQLSELSHTDKWVVISTLFATCLGLAVFVPEIARRRSTQSMNSVDEARADRQIRSLQNRLDRLETLKTASAETLLKNRGQADSW